jgi:hypothetical protein
LLVEPTSSSSIAANEKEVEEPKEKEMEGEKTEKEKSTKERIDKGKKFDIELPAGATYVMLRAVMTITKMDGDAKKIGLDVEGKHDMKYTPWKLIKVTKDSKAWVHDVEKIEERNKKEALEADEEAKQRIEDTLSEWKEVENQIAAADLKKMQKI